MRKKTIQTLFCTLILALAFVICPNQSQAEQAESPVACNESNEPTLLNYGDHTTDCTVNPTTDLDNFTFVGSAGENIRINVDGNTSYFDPRLEIRDPEGTVIVDTYCANGYPYSPCSFSEDIDLTMSGTYSLSISDQGNDEGGDYHVGLQCMFGPCPILLPSVPVCDIQMSQASYTVGETITAQVLRVANPSTSAPVAVEIKTWFEGNGISAIPEINYGADGSFILNPGYDTDFGPAPMIEVTPNIPLGAYQYNCRIVDPVTGRQLTFDRKLFNIE